MKRPFQTSSPFASAVMGGRSLRRLWVCFLAVGILGASCSLPPPAADAWSGDSGIALSRSFGSPTGFTCVVAWDLRYHDTGPSPSSLRIDARFPSAVQDLLLTTTPAGLPLTQPWPRYDELHAATYDVSSTLETMARRRHVVGTTGIPCRSQDATAAMRGMQLRLRWKVGNGIDQEQLITVTAVRDWVRLTLDSQSEQHIEWGLTD